MNRSESKFQNTAVKMEKALIYLLETKSFADISIKDICQKANVNRSTFYAHYDNTYDLLEKAYQNLIQNFLNECNFDSPVDISNMQSLSKDDLIFISPKYLLPYLNYIKQNQRLFKIYASNAHTFNANKMDDYMIENLFIPIYAKYGITDKRLIVYMQKYFLKGASAIINEWVQHNCEDDILFICEIIIYCIRPMNNIH